MKRTSIQKSFNIWIEARIFGRSAMCVFRFIVKLLVFIGALNWGLVGLMNVNIIAMFLGGEMSGLTRLAYILVGLAGLCFLWCWIRKCSKPCGSCPCSKGSCGSCNCGPNCTRCSCGKGKHGYCPCSKGSPSGCHCPANCPRCSCNRNREE